MSTGKTASQTGHAYLGSWLRADKNRQEEYHAFGDIGTKICLECPNLESLFSAYEKAQMLNLPCVLIEDTGRNTTFNGAPTISAVGIGPIMRHEAPFLKRFQLKE